MTMHMTMLCLLADKGRAEIIIRHFGKLKKTPANTRDIMENLQVTLGEVVMCMIL